MKSWDTDTLSSPEVQQFIFDNESLDTGRFVLQQKSICGIPAPVIAQQIEGRRKAKFKLPLFYTTTGIIYPPTLNMEQSSSEPTARFKMDVLSRLPFEKRNLVDLTGGFGIDSFWFSRIFSHVTHVEPNRDLSNIAKHNHVVLGATNLFYEQTSAEHYLSTTNSADIFYLDPSRRTNQNKKLVLLSDTTPNVITLFPTLKELSKFVLIKTSPLLDLQSILRQDLPVSDVFVVAVENECKEVLFLYNMEYIREPVIHSVNIQSEIDWFTFQFSEERVAKSELGSIAKYLYEPNAAVLKAGAFKLIGMRYHLKKLDHNSHFYTGDVMVENFPGRIFSIEEKIKSDRADIKKHFPKLKANVMTRNYPLTVDELKRKLGVSDGGDQYLIGTTDVNGCGLFKAIRIQ